MSLNEAIERRLCPDTPALDACFPIERTLGALAAWKRHHRLVAASALLRGMAQPFSRSVPNGLPRLPSSVLHQEWLDALDVESRRSPPSPQRMEDIMRTGEEMMEGLRSFETVDHHRMHARRLRGLAQGTALSLLSVIVIVPLTMFGGEAWGVAGCLAWFVMVAGSTIFHDVRIRPGLTASLANGRQERA